jgi:hypothetical protein
MAEAEVLDEGNVPGSMINPSVSLPFIPPGHTAFFERERIEYLPPYQGGIKGELIYWIPIVIGME